MAEPARNGAHIVEIPVSVDGGEAEAAASPDKAAAAGEAGGAHPLGEIAASAGHKLLLKLWQREEDRLGRRACALEARMDAARRDAFYLCAAFLAFHGLSLALLFAASVAASASSAAAGGPASAACRRWWAPSSLSLAASLALAAAVQLRVCVYWRAASRLRRERGDARALARAVQELRMKGAAFDLSKEPQYGVTRAKCASVEGAGAWAPLRWCQQNVVTACLLAVAAAALPSGVQGNGFIARDLCIENTAGPRTEQGQAVALLLESDQSVLYRCALRSYQDTLWASSSRQFYRECRISGTVDFIFGNARAIFQNCDVLARLPIQGQENTVTAQGRENAAFNSGFCFQSCTVAADEDLAAHPKGTVQTYLGRPWKPYSRVVFMQSSISDVLDPKGWLPWERQAPPDTLYYAEYKNDGPGAAVGGRVNWRGFHPNLAASEASSFTVEKFINGNDWLPSTGVQYRPGL